MEARRLPGELRRSQNRIGGTLPGNATFVPPPPHLVPELLGNLEESLHPAEIPLLLEAAFAHAQFETIHPFLDGDGRLGRLLVTFLLCSEEVLMEPLLYLSLYFKTYRDTYYELLQKVRLEGACLHWVLFFLDGVRETSQQAFQTARRILEITEDDRRAIETAYSPMTATWRHWNGGRHLDEITECDDRRVDYEWIGTTGSLEEGGRVGECPAFAAAGRSDLVQQYSCGPSRGSYVGSEKPDGMLCARRRASGGSTSAAKHAEKYMEAPTIR